MAYVRTVEENTKGRDFVGGDLHRCWWMLFKALKAVDFDPNKDRYFSTGDNLGKGPYDSDGLKIMSLPWFFSIRGNWECAFEKKPENSYLAFRKASRNTVSIQDYLEFIQKEQPYVWEVPSENGLILVGGHSQIPGSRWQDIRARVMAGCQLAIEKMVLDNSRIRDDRDFRSIEDISHSFHGHHRVGKTHRLRGNRYHIDTGAVENCLGKKPNHGFTMLNLRQPHQGVRVRKGPEGGFRVEQFYNFPQHELNGAVEPEDYNLVA